MQMTAEANATITDYEQAIADHEAQECCDQTLEDYIDQDDGTEDENKYDYSALNFLE